MHNFDISNSIGLRFGLMEHRIPAQQQALFVVFHNKMTRTFFIIVTIFSSTVSMSQTMTFSQRVNQLFFGVDVSSKSGSLIDSFFSVPQLHHHDNGVRQWNLNVSMEMKSDKAWSSLHEFTFTESPLPDLKIKKGAIEVTLGETDSIKKLLNLYWRLQFSDKAAAGKYFDEIKKLFGGLATNKKFERDKNVGDIAQFSTRNPVDTGVRDITIFLGKSPTTKEYEVSLLLGSEFMDE